MGLKWDIISTYNLNDISTDIENIFYNRENKFLCFSLIIELTNSLLIISLTNNDLRKYLYTYENFVY